MPPELEQLQLRLTAFEAGIAKDLNELLVGLKGTATAPGLYETVRKLTDSLHLLNVQVSAMKVDLDSLKETKQRMAGAYLACGTIGAVVGFLASFLR